MQRRACGREELEEREAAWLSPYASLSAETKGRVHPEEKCLLRTEFQRDRDRILHSKAFRRLKHKTQVFIAPEGDHYRTRLTHTLEVAQIARTVARALKLNEDLTEAIALGHDLGHTPFGHAGEAALNDVYPPGFRHNEQSLRVVEKLEGKKGRGLNLTWEVRDGILHHTGNGRPSTPEGKIVHIADRIAYINHDIDDAIRSGIISQNDLPADSLLLGAGHSARINAMVLDLVENSWQSPEIKMSEEVHRIMGNLRKFLFDYVYIGSIAKKEEGKVCRIIKILYNFYVQQPQLLPEHLQENIALEGVERCAVDYVAGMTDRFARRTFEKEFLPFPWVDV